jgi:hypothetical protein
MTRQWAIGLLLALSACGGGGDSGGLAPAMGPSSIDLGAAVGTLVTKGLSANVTLSGTVSGNAVTGSGTYALAPAVSATFGGVTNALAQALTAIFSISAAGQSLTVNSNVTYYYTTGTYTFLGEQDNNPPNSTEFDIALPPLAYPSTVKVGDTAVLGTVMRYTDNTQGVALGTTTVSYLVKQGAAGSNTLIVELINEIHDRSGATTQTDKTDYAVSASGAVSFVLASSTLGADTLTVTAK